MIIETRFDLGQRVWRIGRRLDPVALPCKGCRGNRSLRVELADNDYRFVPCPKCNGRGAATLGSFPHFEVATESVQIGSIEVRRIDRSVPGYNGGEHWRQDEERYMLSSSGFPSGSVYQEVELFASETEARDEADRRNEAIENGTYHDAKPTEDAYRKAKAFLDHRDVYEHTPEHVATARLIVRAYEWEPEEANLPV